MKCRPTVSPLLVNDLNCIVSISEMDPYTLDARHGIILHVVLYSTVILGHFRGKSPGGGKKEKKKEYEGKKHAK